MFLGKILQMEIRWTLSKFTLMKILDKYTALTKFMEQVLEWEIMDYTFYPYYWADRKMWRDMYVSESIDPLFRSFLQAGMARNLTKWFGEANGSNGETRF